MTPGPGSGAPARVELARLDDLMHARRKERRAVLFVAFVVVVVLGAALALGIIRQVQAEQIENAVSYREGIR